jgi:hypothetical protein
MQNGIRARAHETAPASRVEMSPASERRNKKATKAGVCGKSRLTDGRNGGDDLPKLQLVKDGRLTGSIETNHKNAHLLLGEEPLEQLGEREPHRSRKNPPPPPPPPLLLLLILPSSTLTRKRWLPICGPRLRKKHQILQRNSTKHKRKHANVLCKKRVQQRTWEKEGEHEQDAHRQ